LRHDLPPIETSQIAGVFLRDEAVGDHDVLPPVVVEIDEFRSPGPTPDRYASIDADVLEFSATNVTKQRIAPRMVPKRR
jgi:hypothetical protein